MKKLLVSLLVFVFAIGSNAQTAIPNGSFESWNAINYEHPKYYESSNSEVLRNNLPFNAEKSTSAFHGSYALKLNSVANAKDTMFGYIINGSTDDDPDKWHGGAPINERPNGIRGYYKASLVAGDTALVILAFSKAGINIGTYSYKIFNQATTYTLFTYSLSPALSQTPDSVIFAVVSSNPFNDKMLAGSVLYVDSVSLTGITAQPSQLNGDFEQWETKTVDKLLNWYVNDSRYYTSIKTTSAYKGQYAVRLETTLDNRDGVARSRGGYLSTGYYPENCNPCNQMGGYPFTGQTDTLTFRYKYTANGNGKAYLRVTLKRSGNMIWSNHVFMPAASNYQYMELPIFAPQTPDTMIVEIQSNSWEDSTVVYAGSVLFIDEVQLKSQPLKTGVVKNNYNRNTRVFPNPANESLSIHFSNARQSEDGKIQLINATGQIMAEKELSGVSDNLDLRNLPKGIYFYRIEVQGSTIKTGKLFIE